MSDHVVEVARTHFEGLVRDQIERVKRMKSQQDWIDYVSLDQIRVGILGGDGIGPYIATHARAFDAE